MATNRTVSESASTAMQIGVVAIQETMSCGRDTDHVLEIYSAKDEDEDGPDELDEDELDEDDEDELDEDDLDDDDLDDDDDVEVDEDEEDED